MSHYHRDRGSGGIQEKFREGTGYIKTRFLLEDTEHGRWVAFENHELRSTSYEIDSGEVHPANINSFEGSFFFIRRKSRGDDILLAPAVV